MREETVKRDCRMLATPLLPRTTALYSPPLRSWSTPSSAPFPKERKTRS
jgi:hypothetical protein